MRVPLGAGNGMDGAQMKCCMGVAVRKRERQQDHEAADKRRPYRGNEHTAPQVYWGSGSLDSTKRLQREGGHGAGDKSVPGGICRLLGFAAARENEVRGSTGPCQPSPASFPAPKAF